MLIDPILIYLGQVFEGLSVACGILTGVGATIVMVLLLIAFIDDYWEKKYIRIIIISLIITFIAAVGLIATPTKETYYGMVAASYITKDNYELWKGEGKALVDYIFEKVQEGNKSGE